MLVVADLLVVVDDDDDDDDEDEDDTTLDDIVVLLLTSEKTEEVEKLRPEEIMLVGISTLGGLTVTLTLLVSAPGSCTSWILSHFPDWSV